FRFQQRVQKPGESLADFIAGLKAASEHCKFEFTLDGSDGSHCISTLDERLRDQFVFGLRSDVHRAKLLEIEQPDFKTLVARVDALEAAEKSSSEMAHRAEAPAAPKELNKFNKQAPRQPPGAQANAMRSAAASGACASCGGAHSRQQCKLREAKCHNCGKVGHIRKVCRSSKLHKLDPEPAELQEPLFSIRQSGSSKGLAVELLLQGKPCRFEVDTGSALTVIPKSLQEDVLPGLRLSPTSTVLRTYTGESFRPIGQAEVAVQHNGQDRRLTLLVVEQGDVALLGRDWLTQLRLDWPTILGQVNSVTGQAADLLAQFPELLIGRRLRSRLDLLMPSLTSSMQQHQERQVEQQPHAREFQVGDRVLLRDFSSNARAGGGTRWAEGSVVSAGSRNCDVEVGGALHRRHTDQLLTSSLPEADPVTPAAVSDEPHSLPTEQSEGDGGNDAPQDDAATAAADRPSSPARRYPQQPRKNLDYYHSLVLKTVLARQNDITGLIPSTPSSDHAYIRDNTYAAMCTWALALAFKKVAEEDQDRARLRDLEGRTIKCMRSLLACMMRQADKVERFKHTRQPLDALHCKFSASSLSPVTGDSNYGHLQFDAVALYLLALAQMTASGLVLVYTAEETAFVQNLVFYLDAAYMTCDYGVWERGDKTNNGQPELNSTSIGMTKAALEALSELDLYGSSGGCRSFIHVMADDSQNCAAVLDTMLPRESCSKETDAGLLAVIGYPAFAVDREELVASTRNCIDSMLQGRYGYRRFLRDGYRTAVEDPNRLYYEPWELRHASGPFADSDERADRFARLLDRLALLNSDGLPQMPESYSVPGHLVAAERAAPGSQDRHPVGALPHLWTQSLYVICQLLRDKFLRPQEIDPIGRRLGLEAKPDLVVQVVVVAEDAKIRRTLETQFGLKQVQDFAEMYKETKIRVFPAKVLSHFYRHLGKCHQLGLSGRQSSEVGILATSKLYIVGQRTVAFTPQFLDHHSFYLSLDLDFLLDMLRTDVAFLRRTWSAVGRPLFIIPVYHWYFNADSSEQAPSLYTTIKKLQSGYINGTRVTLGKLADFVDTSCVTNMTFLDKGQGDDELAKAKAAVEGRRRGRTRLGSGASATAADAAAIAMRFRAGSVSARKKSVVLSSAAALELALSSLSAADADGEGEGEPFGDEEVPASGVQPSRRRRSSGFGLLGMVPNLNEMINESRRVAEEETTVSAPATPTMLNEDSVDSMKRMVHCARPHWTQLSELHGQHERAAAALKRLAQSDHLYEQFDLLFHLYHTKPGDYTTGWEDANGSGQPVTVRDLVKELYERAGSLRQWWLVRYTAGNAGQAS
uniref:Phosphorylase b kinase regulatory subunit n=1 Tax=Macrostomum lignano TaxID=282301 RepID=A0A1I8HYJ3_9PLAT